MFDKFFILFSLIVVLSCKNKDNLYLKIKKTGGVVGFNQELLIENKTAVFKDIKTNVEKDILLSDDKLKTINEVLKKEKRYIIGEPYPDCVIYEIIFKKGSMTKKILYYPTPSLSSPVDEIINIFDTVEKETR